MRSASMRPTFYLAAPYAARAEAHDWIEHIVAKYYRHPGDV